MKSIIYNINLLKSKNTYLLSIEHKKSIYDFNFKTLNELHKDILEAGFNSFIACKLCQAVGYMISNSLNSYIMTIKRH